MNKPTILLVEDNEVIRRVVLINLKRYLVHVDTASNGREALDLFNKRLYDLVLMDVAMPVLDGLTATAEIRRIERSSGRRVPIVGLTASATREECLRAGMDDYVIKPPDYQRILNQWLPQVSRVS